MHILCFTNIPWVTTDQKFLGPEKPNNKKTATDNDIIANHFKEFFTSIAGKLTGKIPIPKATFYSYLTIYFNTFLEIKNCLFNYQFGFWNHDSTNHALISITETIRKALDDGNYACAVFLDFQKAFATVNHDILLAKPEHYGFRGIPLNLFKEYL